MIPAAKAKAAGIKVYLSVARLAPKRNQRTCLAAGTATGIELATGGLDLAPGLQGVAAVELPATATVRGRRYNYRVAFDLQGLEALVEAAKTQTLQAAVEREAALPATQPATAGEDGLPAATGWRRPTLRRVDMAAMNRAAAIRAAINGAADTAKYRGKRGYQPHGRPRTALAAALAGGSEGRTLPSGGGDGGAKVAVEAQGGGAFAPPSRAQVAREVERINRAAAGRK